MQIISVRRGHCNYASRAPEKKTPSYVTASFMASTGRLFNQPRNSTFVTLPTKVISIQLTIDLSKIHNLVCHIYIYIYILGVSTENFTSVS